MITLYVGGERIGTLADLERLFHEIRDHGRNVELHDEAGRSVAKLCPERDAKPGEPLVPWEPDVTQEELDRRTSEPSFTFEEVKKRLGWE